LKTVDGAKLFNLVGTSGYMSTQNLSEKERIELVDKDRIRRIGQILITFLLIGFSLGFVAWFAYAKADEAFLSYMATGMLGVVFAGVGAAYAIMGLGRTVGSTNGSNPAEIEAMIRVILAAQNTAPGPGTSDEFFEDNQGDNLEEEQIDEVPIGRSISAEIGAVNADPSKLQYLADRVSWHRELKTIDGKPVVLVATQNSRRTKSKRTVYVYHIVESTTDSS